MLWASLIAKKRDGGTLSNEEIRAFIDAVTDDKIADYQTAAMLMAIFFRGLTEGELATWADAMTHSGDVMDLSHIARPKIDKHSTGGVGDKISIPLAPAVAACGVAVPMVSGRGLGHTGGTLDKLESIPGFRVDLPTERFAELVDKLGVCLIGQTERIAPADRRLYALRDVTGTVESIPLIASSIMSKKLAEGIDGLVLDCKVGKGAFLTNRDDARRLSAAMMQIAAAAGKRMTCVLTDMDEPIGRTIGNALEIRESIETLRGGGPRDTRELTEVLGAEMLMMAGATPDLASGRARIAAVLDNGEALAVFAKVVEAQGGDPRVCDNPGAVLPRASQRTPIVLPRGRVAGIASKELGLAALQVGAGRVRKEDLIAPAAGLVIDVFLGDAITDDEPRMWLHHDLSPDDPLVVQAVARARAAVEVGSLDANVSPKATRILETIRQA